ncbi:hypothetical protein [Myxacorys almedinensis]|uniref:Uncharacterized protein n=1 Tax=Myxacorys almedinensis A TaxID=2690445 RepID=A0A8J7Z388_9CYAN|nr:hypothetical protein [Myxacorys almedinensis]NDJ17401.1 hypothetical protein [Myxacorys almedinensis A]
MLLRKANASIVRAEMGSGIGTVLDSATSLLHQESTFLPKASVFLFDLRSLLFDQGTFLFNLGMLLSRVRSLLFNLGTLLFDQRSLASF